MSLKQKLKSYIEANGMVSRDELRDIMREARYDIATTDRKLRELTESGLIKPIYRDKFISAYMWNEPEPPKKETIASQTSMFIRNLKI